MDVVYLELVLVSDEAILKKALEKGEKLLRKRIVQNPQPKLNENTLTGPKVCS